MPNFTLSITFSITSILHAIAILDVGHLEYGAWIQRQTPGTLLYTASLQFIHLHFSCETQVRNVELSVLQGNRIFEEYINKLKTEVISLELFYLPSRKWSSLPAPPGSFELSAAFKTFLMIPPGMSFIIISIASHTALSCLNQMNQFDCVTKHQSQEALTDSMMGVQNDVSASRSTVFPWATFWVLKACIPFCLYVRFFLEFSLVPEL